jgi:hypothetical protein
MPQGDYEGALKRALHISAEWLKIFNTGRGGAGWWGVGTVIWVRFYCTKRLLQFDFFMSMSYGHNVAIMLKNFQ